MDKWEAIRRDPPRLKLKDLRHGRKDFPTTGG